ncbi:MAG: hypothetical protein HOQ45_13160, partial [Nocardioidaceae bacterium]|nr:hypothetical protein [Nocardioidaceae bacterium]
MSPAPDRAYEQAVWAWSEHLRSGGTSTWSAWLASGPHDGSPPEGWAPPGAAQLELVRRAGLSDGFADHVLGRPGPGRGLAQQPLTWP